ncbi:MAG: type I-MYXAN CRISPR-associated protein Cas6/Cmx6 [Firmicutes bacterium]|nr:type I-MYXAN CRISPR-associated protein Cas6/Cmx6 [Bacillota bacterium]
MPITDIHFMLQGNRIPVDHAYHLYSALSETLPWIHRNNVGIQTVSGILEGERSLMLTEKSRLIIRVNSEDIVHILPLAGKTLSLHGNKVTIGIPSPKMLIPTANLYSRIVIIKGFMNPDDFLKAAGRHLQEININAIPSLVEQQHIAETNEGKPTGTKSPYLRRTINIKGKKIVGFALRVNNLTAEESITLQEKGLGGRRKLGCGIFIPDRR